MSPPQESEDIVQTIDDYFGRPTNDFEENLKVLSFVEAIHRKYERIREQCSDDWTKYVLEYREDNKLPLVANLKCLEGAAIYGYWLMKEAHYCRNRCHWS